VAINGRKLKKYVVKKHAKYKKEKVYSRAAKGFATGTGRLARGFGQDVGRTLKGISLPPPHGLPIGQQVARKKTKARKTKGKKTQQVTYQHPRGWI